MLYIQEDINMKKRLMCIWMSIVLILVNCNINVYAKEEITDLKVSNEQRVSSEIKNTEDVGFEEIINENGVEQYSQFSMPLIDACVYVYDIRKLNKDKSDESEIVLSYNEGEQVKFTLETKEGYELEEIYVLDSEGNEIQCESVNSHVLHLLCHVAILDLFFRFPMMK